MYLYLLYFLHLLVFRANFSAFFLHSTSRPFSRLLNYFLCLFTLPTMTKSYSYRSTNDKRSSSSSCLANVNVKPTFLYYTPLMYFSPFSWSYTLPYSCFSCRCLATVLIYFLTFHTTLPQI